MKNLNESVSSVVYHFTTMHGLYGMINDDYILLSKSDPNSIDNIMSKDYPYYLSLTRNYNSNVGYVGKENNYKRNFYDGDVKFGRLSTLNVRIEFYGDLLNKDYEGSPVDVLYSKKKKLEDELKSLEQRYSEMQDEYDKKPGKTLQRWLDMLEKSIETKKKAIDDFFGKYSSEKYGYNYSDSPSYFSETEDRIYSNEPILEHPERYIKAIDILIPNDKEYNDNVSELYSKLYDILRLVVGEGAEKGYWDDKIFLFDSINAFNDFTKRKCLDKNKVLKTLKVKTKDVRKSEHIEVSEGTLQLLSKIIYAICYSEKDIIKSVKTNMKKHNLDIMVTIVRKFKNGEPYSGKGRQPKDLVKTYENVNLIKYVLDYMVGNVMDKEADFFEIRGLYGKLGSSTVCNEKLLCKIRLMINDWLKKYKSSIIKKTNEFYSNFLSILDKYQQMPFGFNKYKELYKELSDLFGEDLLMSIFEFLGLKPQHNTENAISVLLLNKRKVKNLYMDKKYMYNELFDFQKELQLEIMGKTKDNRGKKRIGGAPDLSKFFKGKNKFTQARDYMNDVNENIVLEREDLIEMINECVERILK